MIMFDRHITYFSLFLFQFILSGYSQNDALVDARGETRPNVLFIAIDDLNDWVGFLDGNPQTLTPNLNRLAEESVIFERAYCAASVCNPSRAAIMSGYLPSTTGIYQNGDKVFNNRLINNSLMLPQYFSKYGYETFSRGKIYHTPNTGKHTWDHWENVEGSYGQINASKVMMKNGIPEGLMPGNMDWQATDIAVEKTPDYLNAKWASEIIAQKHDKPFFIGLGIFRPHLEWNVPHEFYDMFDPDTLVMPELLLTDLEDVGDEAKPTKEFQTIRKYKKEREAVHAYLANIAYADYCVGLVLDALEKSEYSENTIVVVWGDHGWHLGEKLRYKKFTLWEESCRVPLLIKAPGLTTDGSRSPRTVNLLDLYPTLVDLAGLPENPKNEGLSIKPLLKDPTMEWDHPSLTQMGKDRNTIRTERWRYIRYQDGSEELYDHDNDPLEWKNLLNDPSYGDTLEEMRLRMHKLIKT